MKISFRLFSIFALLVLAFRAVGVVPAHAAVLTVQSAADDGTAVPGNCPGVNCRLRDAIAGALSGDMITFASNYTLQLASTLTIDKNLIIDGGTNSITISGDTTGDGTNDVLVFSVNPGVSLSLNKLTVANGTGSAGAGIYNAGSLSVTDSTFFNNTARAGGAIYNDTSSTLTVLRGTFTGNQASSWGGGGGYNVGGAIFTLSRATINNSTFTNNQTLGTSNIGAVANGSTGTVTVTGSSFSNNGSMQGGGALGNLGGGKLAVDTSTFTGNSAPAGYAGGGAIWNYSGTLTVTNSTFTSNTSGSVGAVYPGYGGAILNHTGSTAAVSGSTFASNSAVGFGGALAGGGPFSLANNTFQGNSASNSDGGGAIYVSANSSSFTITLTNNTFTTNSASTSANTLYLEQVNSGSLTANLYNNILTTSAAGGNCTIATIPYDGTPTVYASNNLANDSTCGSGFTNSASIRLGTLGSYGGSTQTIPLLPGSSAIDAGNEMICAAAFGEGAYGAGGKDQRDVSRPQGTHCDIGAFESRGFTLGSLTGTPQIATTNTAFSSPLGLTVTANDSGVPVAGLVVTFTAPASGASVTFSGNPATVGADGKASVTAIANNAAGSYQVAASAQGAGTVNFQLSNALPSDDFVITVKTNNAGSSLSTQFVIPTTGSGYNYNVDCNDDGANEATAQAGNYTCNYPAAGTYTIRIKDNTGLGTGFPRIYFNGGGDAQKLLTIAQWGTGKWASMNSAFRGCSNMTLTAADSPDLSGVTDMSYMFMSATAFNGNIGNWNTANVTNMDYVFANARAFNQNIGGWNTGNVTSMHGMFGSATAFNQALNGWNTAKVIDMVDMFVGASTFNGNIGNWDTSSVTTMQTMFQNASAFNQDIGNWNTAKVTTMSGMFYDASVFNQDLGSWNVGALTSADMMFGGVKLSTANYDALLNGWGVQALKSSVSFSGGTSAYCAGAVARAHMISSHGWGITDGGKYCSTSTTLSAAPNPSSIGASVTFTATVSPTPDGGAVTFKDDSTDITGCIGIFLTSGQAACTVSTLAVGSHVITADYSGDTYFAASTGTLSPNQQVNCSNATTVTNADDDGAGSLRQAAASVCANGSITFSSSLSGTIITLASPVTITKNLAIDGEANAIEVGGGNTVSAFVVNAGVTATLKNIAVAEGKADNGGGVLNNGTLLVSNCAFLDNMALYLGGAIYNASASSSATITNCTFSGNQGSGNAIANEGTLVVINSTFAQNASGSSTIYTSPGGNTTLTNSLLSRAMSSQNCNLPVSGLNNLADDASCGAAVQDLAYLGLDSVLDYHGGPTPNYRLLSDSLAIDAGLAAACPATDQRGQPRDDWACDIGAFEAQLGDLATVSKVVSGTGTYTFGPTLARIQVTDTVGCLTGLQVERVNRSHDFATTNLQTGAYWSITPTLTTGCSFTAILTLPFTLADETSRLCRWLKGAGSGAGWDCDDGSHTTFVANTWVIRGNVTGFSDWAVGNNVGPTNVAFSALAVHSSGLSLTPGMIGLFAGLVLSVAIIRKYRRRRNS